MSKLLIQTKTGAGVGVKLVRAGLESEFKKSDTDQLWHRDDQSLIFYSDPLLLRNVNSNLLHFCMEFKLQFLLMIFHL